MKTTNAGSMAAKCVRRALGAVVAMLVLLPASAQTDFAFQYGKLVNPFEAAGTGYTSWILTFQNASGWKYGGSFFFIDFIDDKEADNFNDKEFYGEWYPTLSISKIRGKPITAGVLQDVSLVGGINFDGDANVLKILPGIQLSWKVPGFIFLNTDFAPMFDLSNGLDKGGAPLTEDVGFMFDVSWLLPFKIGSASFAWTGHAEYISGVTNELGAEVKGWILAQPQLTVDVTGDGFFHAGVEMQYWRNKLGSVHDEFAPQLLLVLRM